MDTEDLRKAGSSHKACPYFTSRKWAEEAEVIFCPCERLHGNCPIGACSCLLLLPLGRALRVLLLAFNCLPTPAVAAAAAAAAGGAAVWGCSSSGWRYRRAGGGGD